MKILGIESSCDDTGVALIEASEEGFVVLSEKTASQIDVHKKYGGVVPEVAGRVHAENIFPVIEEVMKDQDKHFGDAQCKPDVIAVTSGPGLITGLLVGVEAAKSLSYLWDVPVVGVNHIEGHVHSVEISDFKFKNSDFPALCLVVSGGHTELLLMKNSTEFELVGKTRDDAVGECFDKVAKLLDLEYPGGPKISKLAATGNPAAINFPRPMLDSGDFDFSFSGLKTAALYWLRDNKLTATTINPIKLVAGFFGVRNQEVSLEDFCASFEQAIVDVLVEKTLNAAKQYKPKTILLSGGVSANKKLRETLEEKIKKELPVTSYQLPITNYTTDNAAMIAVAGYYQAINKNFTDWRDLKPDPNWKVYNNVDSQRKK